jgi:hypothetical protein
MNILLSNSEELIAFISGIYHICIAILIKTHTEIILFLSFEIWLPLVVEIYPDFFIVIFCTFMQQCITEH